MKFLKSMTSKLSKTVSTVLIRLLDQYLLNPEICWHFKIFICGSKFSKIEISRFRPEIGRSTLFSNRIHLDVFSHQRGSGLSQIQHLYTRFCEKPWKSGFYSVWHVEYFTLVEYSTESEISIIKKFITSAKFYILTVFS